VPIVVSSNFAGTQVFASLRERGAFDRVELRCHEDGWLSSTTGVAFAVPRRDRPALLRTRAYLLEALGAGTLVTDGPAVGPASERGTDEDRDVRLYLTRSSGQGRRPRNDEELREVARAHGFEPLDAGALPWPRQVELFRRASHIVGVHGAAFTNMLFRWPSPMRILEIESPLGDEDVFRTMAAELGFELTNLRGTNPSDTSNRPDFDVDAAALDAIMTRWEMTPLTHESTTPSAGR
jgi:hypothetical protein